MTIDENTYEVKLRKVIADNLKRYTVGLSLLELSEKTEIPTSTLSDYFKARTTINPGNVQKIADELGIKKQEIDPRFREDVEFNNSSQLDFYVSMGNMNLRAD